MNNKLCVSIVMGCILFLSGCEFTPTCDDNEVTKKIITLMNEELEREFNIPEDPMVSMVRQANINNLVAGLGMPPEVATLLNQPRSPIVLEKLLNIKVINKDEETKRLTCSADLEFSDEYENDRYRMNYIITPMVDQDEYEIEYEIEEL